MYLPAWHRPLPLRPFVWSIGFVCAAALALTAAFLVHGARYSGRVAPGVHLGGNDIGGMTEAELTPFIRTRHEALLNEGIWVSFTIDGVKKSEVVYPRIISGDNVSDMIALDAAREAEELVLQKADSLFLRAWTALNSRLTKPSARLSFVQVNEAALSLALEDKLKPYEAEPVDAGVRITGFSPFSYSITSSTVGRKFDNADINDTVARAWSALTGPDVVLALNEREPSIHYAEVEAAAPRLSKIFEFDGLDFTYTDSHTKEQLSWHIPAQDLGDWIEPQTAEGDGVEFGLRKDAVLSFVKDRISSRINREARDAKFSVGAAGKVAEFQGSRPGIQVDEAASYTALNDAFLQRSRHDEGVAQTVPLAVAQVEPKVKTGEVNDLGITEILGIGHSNYSGSPTNRVKNIRHAVSDKLNGILIKPDETFSLLSALRPFTVEGGYLPELVISGDRIKPEVGGGLCQIGSTMFRAAMNAGMPIVERRNHSLVVSYYNDLRNNNPGTDATIYDSSPDFKFKNDTGKHLLLTTEMNEKTGDLYFTLWGTSDGRKGYYTEPAVSRWIPYGEKKIIETDELPPGEEKCQHAFKGAEASFTYVRELPNGEKVERVFESYYRPLPEICLVGKEKSDEDERVLGTEEEPVPIEFAP